MMDSQLTGCGVCTLREQLSVACDKDTVLVTRHLPIPGAKRVLHRQIWGQDSAGWVQAGHGGSQSSLHCWWVLGC